MRNLPPAAANPAWQFRKLAVAVATIAAISVALMFSVVVIAVITVIGTIAWGYLWWKTRDLRKQMRDLSSRSAMMEEKMVNNEISQGEVIEGEVIRVTDTRKMD